MVADIAVLLVTLIQETICIFGICFNCAIIWITAKNKNLQNSYGYLLATYSLSEVIYESSSFVPTVLTLMDIKIPVRTCFYFIGFQGTGAGTNAAFSLLFISLDRLIAALFPMVYAFVINLGGCGKYVFVLTVLSIGNSITMIYLNWLQLLHLQHTDISPNYCQPGDQFGGLLNGGVVYRNVINYNLMSAYIATIIVYIILGIYIKFAKSATSSNSQMAQIRKIYKSLAMIMGVVFFFYFVDFFGILLLVPRMTNNPQVASLYIRSLGVFAFIAGALNAPVLYFCSTEYRNALNRQFPFILSMQKMCRNIFMKFTANNGNIVHVQQRQPAAAAMTTMT